MVDIRIRNYSCYFLYVACISLCAFAENQDVTLHNQANNLCNQAKEYIIEKQYDAAIKKLREALDINPQYARAHFYLANALFCTRKYADAFIHYQKTAELLPHNADLYCNLGICANMLEKIDDAILYFEKAIEIDAHCTMAHLQYIASLEKAGALHKAFDACKQLISLNPTHREALLYAATLSKKLEQFETAEWYLRTAYNQNNQDFHIITELAGTLATLEEYDEALTLYRSAFELNPTSLSTFYNIGFILKKLGHLDDAIAIYKQIIKEKPDYALAHLGLGLAYLAQGNFKAGFLEYEWRWGAYNEKPRTINAPFWDGSSVENKRIYVYAEQGYGDTFQFIRYLKCLKRDGAYVIFCPQYALLTFAKLCPYIDEVVSAQQPVPPCDYQIPLMSLPLAYETTIETIPADIPYLAADPTLTEEWRRYLDQCSPDTYKIGICWHGNSQYKDVSLKRAVAQKSCPLALFKKLAEIPHVQLFSLQKISGLNELKTIHYEEFLHLFPNSIDSVHGRFMDTAAIIQHLDLVISVDTSIAHLAAALGVETWNILPEPADWRWMFDRSDTPWYPNMRLFRQPESGDWYGVMQTIYHALVDKMQKNKQLSLSQTSEYEVSS